MPNTHVRRAMVAAALVVFVSLTPAYAAGVEFRWSDLDLGSDAGKAEFDRRVDVAARAMCSSQALTGTRIARRDTQDGCVAGVRDEIVRKVAARSKSAPAAASAASERAR